MSSSITHPASEAARIAASIASGTPVVLAHDGTLEGILTCAFVAFSTPGDVQDISQESNVQPRLEQTVIAVPTSFEAATRVQQGLIRVSGHEAWMAVMAAGASDDPCTGTYIYRFIRYAFSANAMRACTNCKRKATCNTPCTRIKQKRVLSQLTHPCVEPILRLQKQVSNEVEKMRQFIRFQHVEGDLWFAHCNPSCSVVPFIMGHFAARFNSQRFAIYDEVHHMAGISEGGKWQLVATDEIAPPPAMADEAAMQDAWKRFYHALSIEARYNPELRRNFMPMRLWKNIVEVAN